jgi:hypothetical protein
MKVIFSSGCKVVLSSGCKTAALRMKSSPPFFVDVK